MGRNASLVREASQAQVIEKGIFSFYLFFLCLRDVSIQGKLVCEYVSSLCSPVYVFFSVRYIYSLIAN